MIVHEVVFQTGVLAAIDDRAVVLVMGTSTVAMLVIASLLLLHQMLIKHLLVAYLVIDVVIELEVHTVKVDSFAVFIVVNTIDLLVDHFHDLVLVEAI